MGNKFKSRRLACEDASLRRENVQQDAKVWKTSFKSRRWPAKNHRMSRKIILGDKNHRTG